MIEKLLINFIKIVERLVKFGSLQLLIFSFFNFVVVALIMIKYK